MPTKQIGDRVSSEMILEFRCASANGRTVQDVLPPSIHPDTGQQYQWGGHGNWQDLPTMSEALLTLWRLQLQAGTYEIGRCVSSTPTGMAVEDTPRRRAVVAAQLEHISSDCVYDRYRSVVWAIMSLGWPDGVDIAKRWCLTAEHRFDSKCFHRIASSYDESRSPSLGTIIHFAREGGWNG